MKTYKYNYFYKITNLINGHFYYGVHSTDNLNDGYLGSGTRLHYAYKKYGVENFNKEILKYFNTREEMYNYEASFVTEQLIEQNECYNLVPGGRGMIHDTKSFNNVVVRLKGDNTYKYFLIPCEEYYKNKEKYISAGDVWHGRHHSDYSKNKTRKRMTPVNSNNDRIWVNKNGVVKYILKIYLKQFLSDGWELGRKNYKPRKGCQGKLIK